MVTHTSNGWGLETAEMMFASNVKREGPWGSLDRVFVLTEVCRLWGFPTRPLPPVPWGGTVGAAQSPHLHSHHLLHSTLGGEGRFASV